MDENLFNMRKSGLFICISEKICEEARSGTRRKIEEVPALIRTV